MNSNSETPEIQIEIPQNDSESLRHIAEYMLREFTPEDVQIFKEWQLWCKEVTTKHAFANFGLLYADKFHFRLIHRMSEFASSTNVSMADLVSEIHKMLGDVENPDEVKKRIYETLEFFQNNPESSPRASFLPSSEPAPASLPPQSGVPISVRNSVNEVVCPTQSPEPVELFADNAEIESLPDDEEGEFKIAPITGVTDARFERLKDKLTSRSWVEEDDIYRFKKVCRFVEGLPQEQVPILYDLVNYRRHDLWEEFDQLTIKHGKAFVDLNQNLEEMADQLGCPLLHLKILVAISLQG